jgi:hypothetical protein
MATPAAAVTPAWWFLLLVLSLALRLARCRRRRVAKLERLLVVVVALLERLSAQPVNALNLAALRLGVLIVIVDWRLVAAQHIVGVDPILLQLPRVGESLGGA